MKKDKDDRGIWRAIYCSLWDDPDFQKLNSSEKLLLLNLRTNRISNAICIYPYYVECIERQTSLSKSHIESSLKKLFEAGWIEIEAGVVWIKNGLKYDPNITMSNDRHAIFIKREIQSLPKLKIVKNFCDYYGIGNGIAYPDTPAIAQDNQEKETKQKKTMTDEEWFIYLKNNPAYRGIDIEQERGKCEAWCLTHKRSYSRQTFLNWLNRAEKPMATTPYKLKSPPSEAEKRPEMPAEIREKLKEIGKKII